MGRHCPSDVTASLKNSAAFACYRSGQGGETLRFVTELRELRLQPDTLAAHAAILEHVVRGDDENAGQLYMEVRNQIRRPWIMSKTHVDMSNLSFELAALALRIRLEDARRHKIGGKLVINTPKGAPDPDGFDSPLKRSLYFNVLAGYNIKVDYLTQGKMEVERSEVRRLWEEFEGNAVEVSEARAKKTPKKKRRRAALKTTLDLVYDPEREAD